MAPYQQLGCVGLIGDVHAEDELLEAALDYLNTKNIPVCFVQGMWRMALVRLDAAASFFVSATSKRSAATTTAGSSLA